MSRKKKKEEMEFDEEGGSAPVVVKTDYSDWSTLDAIQGYKEETDRLRATANAIGKLANGELSCGYFPKGILLSGDPGVGKTTAAKGMIVLAAASGALPTVVVPSDPEPKDVEDAFAIAATSAPCFVFIDDVDRVVPDKDPIDGFSSDETKKMLKTLLSCIDGVSQVRGVVVVMTSNGYYGLDPALRRPGRIDLHIPFDLPDDASREAIARHYLGEYDNMDVSLAPMLAKKMGGLTGAQIKTIINDVWIYYASQNPSSKEAMLDTFQKRIMEAKASGILKKVPMKAADFERVCYHEAGHAVSYYVTKGEYTDVCVLQQAGSDFGGWTETRYGDDTQVFLNGHDCIAEIACALGGLVAEKAKFGNWTTGVLSDMSSANKILANFMFCCLLDEGDEPDFAVLPTTLPSEAVYEAKTPGDIQVRSKKIGWSEKQYNALKSGYDLAMKSVSENMDILESVALRLKSNFIVSAETMKDLVKEVLDKRKK